MNPNQTPNLAPQGPELPTPIEQSTPTGAPETANKPLEAPVRPVEKSAPAERKSSVVERQPVQQAPAQVVNAQQAPIQMQPPVSQPAPTINQISQDDNPVIADDIDVIEKEWVNKAKEVVKNTSLDPFEQEKQVSKLQADYLKKRYNKDVKLSSD